MWNAYIAIKNGSWITKLFVDHFSFNCKDPCCVSRESSSSPVRLLTKHAHLQLLNHEIEVNLGLFTHPSLVIEYSRSFWTGSFSERTLSGISIGTASEDAGTVLPTIEVSSWTVSKFILHLKLKCYVALVKKIFNTKTLITLNSNSLGGGLFPHHLGLTGFHGSPQSTFPVFQPTGHHPFWSQQSNLINLMILEKGIYN